jgi:predicted lipoprotein with Yx(FWY)xxD motif
VGNWAVRTRSTSALEPLRVAPAPGVADPVLDGNHGKAKGCRTGYCSDTVLAIGPHVHLDMSRLTIEGALDSSSLDGGGVRNDLGGNLSVSGCTFYDDQASWGGAIDNADANGTGTLVVTASTFRDDEALHGGAINNHGRASVSGSVFSGNRSANGGAIDNGDRGRLVVASSSFSANSALDDGGAIDNADHLGQGSLRVSGSTFKSNRAHDGGAIANADNSGAGALSVQSSKFRANSSGNDGGAIDNADPAGDGTVSVSGSVLSGNSANGTIGAGGAIYNGPGSVSVSTSTLADNGANGPGGAIANGYDHQPPPPPAYAGAEWPAAPGTEGASRAGAVANGAETKTSRLSVSASTFSGNGAGWCGQAVVNGEGVPALADIWDSTFDDADPSPSGTGPSLRSSVASPLLPQGIAFPTCGGGDINNYDGSLWVWASTFVGATAYSNNPASDAVPTAFIYSSAPTWAVANIFAVGTCGQPLSESPPYNGPGMGGPWHDMGYNVTFEQAEYSSNYYESCIGNDVKHDLDVHPPWEPKVFVGPVADNGGPTNTALPLASDPALRTVPYGTVVKMDDRTIVLCPTTDQRGTRSAPGRACDAGAVQVPYGISPIGTEVSALSSGTYGSILVVGGSGGESSDGPGQLIDAPAEAAGSPLYGFSGDANGKFRCTTRPVPLYTSAATPNGVVTSLTPTSCTGQENDFLDGSNTDDWPAFTTSSKPVAGPGVVQALLGTVPRPGIGNQVTYDGHPLYLFDQPSTPFHPYGEGYLQSVFPMGPWRGISYLVSAQDGRPAPGPVTVGAATLPDKRAALAYIEFAANLNGTAVTVYSYSLDRPGVSACTGACALTWLPLLTRGKPEIDNKMANAHIVAQDVGFIRRPDGTEQATYQGKPLYLYSGERYLYPHGNAAPPSQSGTAGNGNGLRGPKGGTFSIVNLGQ